MSNFWSVIWFYVKRILAAIGPFILSLISGAFFAGLDALRAAYDSQQPLTWGTLWVVGGGAFVTYIITKALHADKTDWMKVFLQFASVITTPPEMLNDAAAQVKPLTSVEKIGNKVLPDSTGSNPQG